LADSRAFSGFAVPDIEAARDFYRDKLGLDVSEENGLLTLHLVDNIEQAVDDLTGRGVSFETYDGFDQTSEPSFAEEARRSRGSRTRQATSCR
jgi:catechol 2,3-dioxygenase-like lactoylglutathione lyase family enzyme